MTKLVQSIVHWVFFAHKPKPYYKPIFITEFDDNLKTYEYFMEINGK